MAIALFWALRLGSSFPPPADCIEYPAVEFSILLVVVYSSPLLEFLPALLWYRDQRCFYYWHFILLC